MNIEKIYKSIKMAIPISLTHIEYFIKLIFISKIEDNRQINNSFTILAAFFSSIYFSKFLISSLSLKLNILDSLDSINTIKFFIHNALPISIVYAFVIYLTTFKFDKRPSNLIILFIQGIKVFTIFNIFLALGMAYEINQLIMGNINPACHSIVMQELSNNAPWYLILIAIGAFIYSIGWILIKPTYQFLSQAYSSYPKWSIWLITLIAFIAISVLNHSLYSLYPSVEAKEIIVSEKFCKEISELKILQNNECNLTKEDIMDFRQKCQNMINNTK